MLFQGILGGTGEGVAQAITDGKVDWDEVLVEAFAELTLAPVEVLGVGGRMLGEKKRKTTEGLRRGHVVKALVELAKHASMQEHSPEGFAGFVAEAAKGSGIETMYFPVDDFMKFFQSRNMAPADIAEMLPGVEAADIERALTTGEDVAVPTATFMDRLVGDEEAELFAQENVKFHPDDFTPKEAARFASRSQLEEAKVAGRQRKEKDARKPDDMAADEIYEVMVERLVKAGRPREVASREARVYPAFFKAVAQRSGKSVRELVRAYKAPRVEGPMADVEGGDTLKQSAVPNSPAFRRFSGGGHVLADDFLHDHDFSRDKPGTYRIMRAFHGTMRRFNSFDKAGVKGSIFGFLGRMNYFTSSLDDAHSHYTGGGPDHDANVEKDAQVIADLIIEELNVIDVPDTTEGEAPRVREAVEKMLANPELPEKFRNIDIDAIDTDLFETNGYYGDDTMAEGLGKDISANQIHTKEGARTLDVYIRTKNPLVVNDKVENETHEAYEDEDGAYEDEDGDGEEAGPRDGDNMFYDLGPELGAAWRVAKERVDALIDATDPETRTEYPRDMLIREVGKIKHPFVDVLNKVARQYDDVDVPRYLYDFIMALGVDGIRTGKVSHNTLFRALWDRNAARRGDDVAGVDMTAEIIQALGFDAVILKGAENQFSDMSIPPDTTHIHVFDKDAGNVKSATDNEGTYDADNPNIFKQSTIKPKSDAFKKYAEGAEVLVPEEITGFPFKEGRSYVLGVWHGTPAPEKVQSIDTAKSDEHGASGKVFYTTSHMSDAEGYANPASERHKRDRFDPDVEPLRLYVRTDKPFVMFPASNPVLTGDDIINAVRAVVPIEMQHGLRVREKVEAKLKGRKRLPNIEAQHIISVLGLRHTARAWRAGQSGRRGGGRARAGLGGRRAVQRAGLRPVGRPAHGGAAKAGL